jgi:hypothetical protein
MHTISHEADPDEIPTVVINDGPALLKIRLEAREALAAVEGGDQCSAEAALQRILDRCKEALR